MSAKKTFFSLLGGVAAAAILSSGAASAEESDKGAVMQADDDTISPLSVPVDGGGHTWTYVKTVYTSSGYIKLYSDRDSYWYYTKEVYYDKTGKVIKTVYDRFAL
ncbi:hypothetical protein D3H55_00065 [Bacillus salacetis]|uniref:Tat pathway signal sequence domain protein n=1 Tax=Bacillus salacetis TaxID=2315464 RepID=A0A3A1RBK5_9BACI|nr:hypothetical protein [Bacillus salacetis]RIW38793.1 hypothetical protein D3H55_00065 [Bacillus salacetis]